ncbi:ATP-binding protein [Skermania sp. ID1734]|uniref:ATP-binding protein n=1 Tax=Skermania sp. ID1734 TaxID=2597516 RepID=UPI0021078B3A|nr:ATP-binding protein [Skermania sp. ID1734]
MTDTQLSPSTVELRVSASPNQLSVVRAVAATIAGQCDFDLDEIADVRLAIDEACSHLIVRAHSEAVLQCTFEMAPNALQVTAMTITSGADSSSRRSFGWHVLNTLADSVTMTQDAIPDRPDSYRTSIEFVKEKAGGAA